LSCADARPAAIRRLPTYKPWTHTAANTELQQIAKQADISLPAQPTGKNAAEGQKLLGSMGQR
jgi:hypothetical protein